MKRPQSLDTNGDLLTRQESSPRQSACGEPISSSLTDVPIKVCVQPAGKLSVKNNNFELSTELPDVCVLFYIFNYRRKKKNPTLMETSV